MSLILEHFNMFLTIGLFVFVLSAIIFEYIDKVLAVMLSTFFLILFSVIEPGEIMPMIDFKTIFLLLGMMILVEVTRESKLLSWMNIQIVEKTQGNPLFLFVLFSSITFILSTFLANATTMMVLVPITIALTRGMGLDPKPYLFTEIVFSDIGGALTLIGDPTNVMIGSANNFSFLDFLKNMSIPIFSVFFVVLGILIWKNWELVKPIKGNIPKLFMNNLLMNKIREEFHNQSFNKKFAIITAGILAITVFFFVFNVLHLPIEYIALLGATAMLLFTEKFSKAHHTLNNIDWHMLIFFAGLFIQIGALEKVGALEPVSHFIATHATTALELSLMVMWFIGLLSAFIENIPLVAMMIPVLQDVLSSGTISGNTTIVWYALSLGACLGGNGSLIGSSANMIVAQTASRMGVKISFWEYFKVGYPLTLVSLVVSSIFLYFSA